MKVDDLILTESIGQGSYAEVFLTTKVGSPELFATKRMDRANAEKPENLKRLVNEVTILKTIKHPNIIRLVDTKKTKTHCYIVTEFLNGGDLYSNLKKYNSIYKTAFTEEIVQYLMRQIVNAIYYLHSNKIVHRDLKLENILLNFPTEQDKNSANMMSAIAKIIDFGFATRLRSSNANLTYTILGTPSNMDPILLKQFEARINYQYGYDEKADIWSLGTMCYEMLTGHMTFNGKNLEELAQNVKKGIYSLPLNLSNECASFIIGMLQYDPNKRLSAGELLNHDFLVKDCKYFKPIDIKKIQKKINGDVLNIDIKNNQSIVKIINQDNHQNKIINNNDIINQDKNNQAFLNLNLEEEHKHHHKIEQPNGINNQSYAVVKKITPKKNTNNMQKKLTYTNQTQGIFPMPEIPIEIKQNTDKKNKNKIDVLQVTPVQKKNYIQKQYTYSPPTQDIFSVPETNEIKQNQEKKKKEKNDEDDIFDQIPIEYTYYGNAVNNVQANQFEF